MREDARAGGGDGKCRHWPLLCASHSGRSGTYEYDGGDVRQQSLCADDRVAPVAKPFGVVYTSQGGRRPTEDLGLPRNPSMLSASIYHHGVCECD